MARCMATWGGGGVPEDEKQSRSRKEAQEAIPSGLKARSKRAATLLSQTAQAKV